MTVPVLWRADPPPGYLPACPPDCRQHPQHIYILCFGRPVKVADRDYLDEETARDYPIHHYVGWTRRQPPVIRIRAHSHTSARHIAHLQPGDEQLELRVKESWRCPWCGSSLWYYAIPYHEYAQHAGDGTENTR